MAKCAGVIGFGIQKEKEINGKGTGIWNETVIERNYRGDLLRNNRKFSVSGEVNNTLILGKDVSIIADIYAFQNYQNILYFKFNGDERPWCVESIEIDRPRMKLTIGGIWNGQQA